jgi:DNA processing protein
LSSDLLARLRLVRSPGIGPVTFRQLLMRFGSAEAALDAVPQLAARGGGKAPVMWSANQAEAEMARVEALGGRYLSIGQGLYPRR